MKKIIIISVITFFRQYCFSQDYIVGNDSISFTITTIENLSADSIIGFHIKLINKHTNRIGIGYFQDGVPKLTIGHSTPITPSCFIYTFGNKIYLLMGGTRPGLNEPFKEWINIMPLFPGSSLEFKGNIWTLGMGKCSFSKSQYEKMEKLFVIDYLPYHNKDVLKYEEFQATKSRLFMQCNK